MSSIWTPDTIPPPINLKSVLGLRAKRSWRGIFKNKQKKLKSGKYLNIPHICKNRTKNSATKYFSKKWQKIGIFARNFIDTSNSLREVLLSLFFKTTHVLRLSPEISSF